MPQQEKAMSTFQETESAEVVAEARSLLAAMRDGNAFDPEITIREAKGGPKRLSGGSRVISEHVGASVFDAEAAGSSEGLFGRKAKNQQAHKQKVEADWKKAQGKKIGSDATMGDWVATQRFMNFYEPVPSPTEIFAAYIGVGPEKVAVVKKSYPRMMVSVLRYAVTQIAKKGRQGSYGFEDIRAKVGEKEWLVGSGMKNLVAVQTGPESISQVAAEPTLGVTDGKKKMCFALRETYNGCVITVYGQTEDDTEDFLGWLNQQVKLHNFLKKAKIDGKGEFLKLGEYTWDDIVLRKGIREKIESNVMDLFRQEEIYLTNGIPPKRGFALVGPPGTGKTLLTKIMAWALKDVTFIWITPSSIYGSSSIGDFYELAQELAPTIVFFEDADVYLGQRGTMEASGGILTELMNRLDGIVPIRGVVTGLSSNRPEVLESALIRRPGRFDMVLELGPPDDEGRLKLLRKYFKKPNVESGAIEKLSQDERIHGMEPCKLEEIVRRSVLQAIEKGDYDKKSLVANVTWQHIQDGLAEYLKEQDFKSTYFQAESRGSMKNFSEALDSAGLTPLHEQAREEEDRIRDFVKLIAPDGMSEEDLFDNTLADNSEALAVWEEVLDDARMLRRFGVKRANIRSAKKIVDNDDITGEDIIRMLTGEE